MSANVDGSSPAVNGRIEAKRSVMATAFSMLATASAFFGAGAAMASPSCMTPGDAFLAFHA